MQPHQHRSAPMTTDVGEHKSRGIDSNMNTATSPATNQMVNCQYSPQTLGESTPHINTHSQNEPRYRKRSHSNVMARPSPATTISDGNAVTNSTASASASTHIVRPVDSPYLMPQVESFVSINLNEEVLAPHQQTNNSQIPPSSTKQQSKELRSSPFASSHFLAKTSLKLYSPTETRKTRSNTTKGSLKSHKKSESSLLRVNTTAPKYTRMRRATSPAIDRFDNWNLVSDFIAGQAREYSGEYQIAPPRSSSLTSCASSNKSNKSYVSQNSVESTAGTSPNTSLVRVAATVAAVSKRADQQRRRSPTEGSNALQTNHAALNSMPNLNTLPATRRHRHSQSIAMPISINTNLDGSGRLADLPLDQLLTPSSVLPLSQMNRHDIPLTLPEISPFTPLIDDRRFSEGDSKSLIDIINQFTFESADNKNKSTLDSLNTTSNNNHDNTNTKQEKHTIENSENTTLTSQSVPADLAHPISHAISDPTHNNYNNNDQQTGNNNGEFNSLSSLSLGYDLLIVGDNVDNYIGDHSNIWPDAPNSTFIWDSSCYGEKLVAEETLDAHNDYYDAISYRPSPSSHASQVSSPTSPIPSGQFNIHDINQRQVLVSRGRLNRASIINKKSAHRSLVPIYVKPPSSNKSRLNDASLQENTSRNPNNANMSYASISVEPPTPHVTPDTPTKHIPRGSSLDLDRILEPFYETSFDAHKFRKECVWMGVATNRTRDFLFPKLARVVRKGIEEGRFGYNEKAVQRMSKLAADLTGPPKGTLIINRVTPWELATTTTTAIPTLLRSSSLRRARSDESLRSSSSERVMLPHRTKFNIHRLGDDLSHRLIRNKRI